MVGPRLGGGIGWQTKYLGPRQGGVVSRGWQFGRSTTPCRGPQSSGGYTTPASFGVLMWWMFCKTIQAIEAPSTHPHFPLRSKRG